MRVWEHQHAALSLQPLAGLHALWKGRSHQDQGKLNEPATIDLHQAAAKLMTAIDRVGVTLRPAPLLGSPLLLPLTLLNLRRLAFLSRLDVDSLSCVSPFSRIETNTSPICPASFPANRGAVYTPDTNLSEHFTDFIGEIPSMCFSVLFSCL